MQRWRAILGVVVGAALCSVCPQAGIADSEDDWLTSIACRLCYIHCQEMTSTLRGDVKDLVTALFDIVYTGELKVDWLEDSRLPPVTVDNSASIGDNWWQAYAGKKRIIQLVLWKEGGWYVVKAREYDPRFRLLGREIEERIALRAMVPEIAGRAALLAHTPIGQISGVEGAYVSVRFPGGAALAEHLDWLGLRAAAGMEILVDEMPAEAGQGTGGEERRPCHRMRFRDTFLLIRNWSVSGVDCTLAGQRPSLSLTYAGPRYYARPMRSEETERIEVLVLDAQSRPLAGCELFAATKAYSTDRPALVGVSGLDGKLSVPVNGRGVLYLSARYEGLNAEKIVLPGLTTEPVTFRLPTRGRRAEFVDELERIYRQLRDQARVRNEVVEQLRAALSAGEAEKVRRLVAAAEQSELDYQEVEARVERLRRQAAVAGEDVDQFATDLLQYAKRVARPLITKELRQWSEALLRRQKRAELLNRLKECQAAFEWYKLAKLYEQLLALDPDDERAKTLLASLTNDLKIKDAAHAAAREFVDTKLDQLDYETLKQQRDKVGKIIAKLLEVEDHLWLAKVRRAMLKWAEWMSREGDELKKLAEEAKSSPDEDRNKEVEVINASITRLKELSEDWQKWMKEIDELIQRVSNE